MVDTVTSTADGVGDAAYDAGAAVFSGSRKVIRKITKIVVIDGVETEVEEEIEVDEEVDEAGNVTSGKVVVADIKSDISADVSKVDLPETATGIDTAIVKGACTSVQEASDEVKVSELVTVKTARKVIKKVITTVIVDGVETEVEDEVEVNDLDEALVETSANGRSVKRIVVVDGVETEVDVVGEEAGLAVPPQIEISGDVTDGGDATLPGGTKRRKSFLQYLVEEVEDAAASVASALSFSKGSPTSPKPMSLAPSKPAETPLKVAVSDEDRDAVTAALADAVEEKLDPTVVSEAEEDVASDKDTKTASSVVTPPPESVDAVISSETVAKRKSFFQSFVERVEGAVSSSFTRDKKPQAAPTTPPMSPPLKRQPSLNSVAGPVLRSKEQGPPVPISAVTGAVRATNPILDELLHAIELIQTNDPSLVRLDLNNCNVFTVSHGTALAEGLAGNTCVREIYLKNTKLQSITAFEIAKALKKNKSVEILDLESNLIAPAGIKALAECLMENTTLTELNLSNQKSPAGTDAEQSFARALQKNETLLKLSLQIRDNASRNAIDRSISRNKDLARKRRNEAK
ncbi:Leiomodin-1 [Phlyctochytrium planicorne]|nr:Leiomodin-1 [Phlyctochytrium planicorne]